MPLSFHTYYKFLKANRVNLKFKQRWKTEAIGNCDIIVYTKIFLKFPKKFWPCDSENEFFIYAHEQRGYYTFWQVLLHYDHLLFALLIICCLIDVPTILLLIILSCCWKLQISYLLHLPHLIQNMTS